MDPLSLVTLDVMLMVLPEALKDEPVVTMTVSVLLAWMVTLQLKMLSVVGDWISVGEQDQLDRVVWVPSLLTLRKFGGGVVPLTSTLMLKVR